ncbi:MAG: serine/threonine protein kinase [Opitutaceae bacterium]|nr:serine/threonine protein kinase [Verrucomicrobiales bacterium]
MSQAVDSDFNPETTKIIPVSLRKVGGGRFTLRREVGRGGMGVVWLAFDELLRDEVALKMLPKEIRLDPVALDDLRRETLRSRKLSHPNIVRIHDLFEAPNDDAFISMEFVDGRNLSALRMEKPNRVLSWAFLEPMVRQLCDALHYAHGERVVHRDLKPANLMLDQKQRLKLADFGIARVISDTIGRISAQRNTSGTLVYMSPQQLDGAAPQVTDDIYSMGATIYELLTSKPPFFTGDISHQVRNIAAKSLSLRLSDFEVTNEIPPQVTPVILACLEKDPSRRPQSAREVAARLGLLDEKVEIVSTPADRFRLPYALGRVDFVRVIAASALLAVPLLSAGWYFGIYEPDQRRVETEQAAVAAQVARARVKIRATQSAEFMVPTAFLALKEGDRFLNNRSRGKVVRIVSTRSADGTAPTNWSVFYFDPLARQKLVEVQFRGREMMKVHEPGASFGGLFAPLPRPLDNSKLAINSDEAIRILMRQPEIDKLPVRITEMELLSNDRDEPTWRIVLWSVKRRDTNLSVRIGELVLSGSDGRIITNTLKPSRVD